MRIILELIGYAGTAFVLVSMMMTSVGKLRVFNLCGSVLSMVYAYATATWPVFVLNLCLTVINSIQLYRLHHPKKEEQV